MKPFSSRVFPLADRTYAQRMQDDEDHRLRMCGLLPDPRDEEERNDFYRRHYDADPFAQRTSSACANAPTSDPVAPAGGGFLRSVPRSMEGLRAEAGPLGYTPRPDGPATAARRAA